MKGQAWFALLLSLLTATPVVAQEISFTVRKGEETLPGQELDLLGIQQGQVEKLDTGRTGPAGQVRFSVPDQDADSLVGSVTYDGLTYFSDLIPTSQAAGNFEIRVYPQHAGTEGLRVLRNSYSFEWRDGELSVLESFELLNPTPYTLTGTDDKLFHFSIPRGAFNLQRSDGLTERSSRQEGGTVILVPPLQPGTHYISYRYQMDRPQRSLNFSREFSVPVESLEVSLPEDSPLGLGGQSFTVGERKFFGTGWSRVYIAKPQAKEFEFVLTGLPIPWIWWLPIVSFFGLALGAILLRNQAPPQTQKKQELLLELKRLQNLYDRNVLSQTELQERKLGVYERLIPLYENASINHASRLQA